MSRSNGSRSSPAPIGNADNTFGLEVWSEKAKRKAKRERAKKQRRDRDEWDDWD